MLSPLKYSKRGYLFVIAMLMAVMSQAQTTATQAGSDGLWNTAANWTNGLPAAGGTVTVSKALTIDTDISVSNGGLFNINSPITDASGTPYYALTVSGGGGSNKGLLNINANATFEGTLNVNSNGQLTVEPGCTLTVGTAVFANGSIVNVKAGGVLIVNGDLTNNNNSDNIKIDGTILVNGDFSGGNGSAITGTGVVSTTGSMTNTGTGNVFGVGTTCGPTGPCSTANFCGSNTITPTSTSVCSGNAPGIITGSTLAGYSYQWQSFAGTTGPWTNVTTLGAGNRDFTPGTLTATTSYRRYVTNGTCVAYSSVIQVVVNTAPTITAQPTAQTSCVGSTATFTVTATGATGSTLTYQWRKNGTNVSTGGTSASYTTPALVIGDNGALYSVVVSSGGCTSTTSNNATLTVNATPTISSHPASVSRCVGSTATFSVTATGTGLTYQWQKNGVNVSGGTGGTTASYTTPATVAGDNGAVYTVIVRSTGGCTPLTSNSATLTINTAPSITAQPTAQTSCVGSTATFTVTATGSNLTYQWRRNGTNVSSGTGATSATFTTAALVAGDAGNYSVVVSSTGCTSATSNNAALTVNAAPAITAQPTASVTRCVGTTATFSVTATGTGLTYQWKKNGVNVTGGSGGTTNSYTTGTLVAGDNGAVYTVVVSSTGSCTPLTSNGATLTVNIAPTITVQPTAQTSCVGSTATFTVTATGTNLTYQWRRNAVNVTGGTGGTTTSYTTASLVPADAGNYSVVVSNTGCTAATSNNAALTVNVAPAITAQPSATSACVGSTASFTVTATGTGLTYQWQKNGVNVSGGTGGTTNNYTTPTLATGDNGAVYTVIVSSTGSCTPLTSNNATLTVNTAPVISTQPVDQTVCAGGTASFSVATSAGTNLTYQWKKGSTNVGTSSASYTTPATVAGDNGSLYSVVVSSAGCTSATSSNATLMVNTAAVISASPVSISICLGTTATFSVATSAGSNLSYQWSKNGSDISGATATSYTTPSAIAGDNGAVYTVLITSPSCVSVSANATLTVGTTNQWTGSSSSNWATSSNWNCNVVPNSNLDVLIPSSLSTYPVIPTGVTVVGRNITLSSGATLTLAGNTSLIQVYGDWTNGGIFNAGTGKVEFLGSASTQTISNTNGKEKYFNLTVNKSAGSVVIASSTSIDIIAGGTVQVTNGTLNLNSRPFNLKSAPNRTYNDGTYTHSVDSTARLGVVTGTLSNASNFSIERYIYAPSAKPRILSTSVSGMQAAQWADSVCIFGGDFRVLSGFPTTTSTLYWYNEAASQGTLSKGFSAIVSKATVLSVGRGYRVIVGYDNNPAYTSPAKSSVTLKMRGVPQIGSMSFPIQKSGADPYGWNMLGNPYPCEISWNSIYSDNQTYLSPTVAIMDPRSGGTSDYYYYNAFTGLAIDPRYAGTGATAYTTTPRFNSDVIASSQGFYVFKTTAGAGTINFSESQKAVNRGMVESNFRTSAPTNQYLNIGVLTNAGYTDNTYVLFSEDAAAESFDILYDVYKLDNFNVNIMTNTFGIDMAMNGLNHKEGDVLIPLIVSTEAGGIHQLDVQGIESLDADKEVYLIDEYTNTVTALTINNHAYSFSYVDGDAASTSRDRFILRVSNSSLTTATNNATSKGTLAIYPNPATDLVTFSLTDAPADTYHIQIVNTQGILVYEENRVINGGTFALHNLDELLTTGVYVVKITASEKSYIDKLVIK